MTMGKTRRVWLLTQGCGSSVFASLTDAKTEAKRHADIPRWEHPYAGLFVDPNEESTKIEQLDYHPRARSMRQDGNRPMML